MSRAAAYKVLGTVKLDLAKRSSSNAGCVAAADGSTIVDGEDPLMFPGEEREDPLMVLGEEGTVSSRVMKMLAASGQMQAIPYLFISLS